MESATNSGSIKNHVNAMMGSLGGNDKKVDVAINLLSVILTPPSSNKPTTPEEALRVYVNTVGENNSNLRNTFALFTEDQKKAIQKVIDYAQANDVDQEEAVRLIETYSSGMKGGSKKKHTRRRKHKKTMKKRKTKRSTGH